MTGGSAILTIGLALDHAQQHGLRVDIGTSGGREFRAVRVAAIDRFCVVLVEDDAPEGKAHVVNRDHVVSVSLLRSELLAIESGQSVGASGTNAVD